MTTPATRADEKHQQELREVAELYERVGLQGFWMERPSRPAPAAEPRLWRWADVYPAIMRAAEVVRLGEDTDRRASGLQLGSRTLSTGFQVVKPGESAAAHRHTASALRFIVQGSGAYTTSNGERMFMEPGDLITQPNWAWHDHNNFSGEDMIWLDALDAMLVRVLDARFHEDWVEGETQPISKEDDDTTWRFGLVRPDTPGASTSPIPFRYKWSDTLQALEALAKGEGDPYDAVLLEYKHPVTGGHTFLTISCRIQMLRPGEATRSHRHTGTTIHYVVRGQGVTRIDRKDPIDFDWSEKDSFMIPPWRWHEHRNASTSEPAIVFSLTDAPVLEALGLHREERG